jgi:hypothetical protein
MISPTHADDLTPEWLTVALRAAGALGRGRVTTLGVHPLDKEKGLASQIVRIYPQYDERGAAGPRSLIAKFSPPDPQTRAVIHSMGFFEREVRFYEQLANRDPLLTPHCYFSMLDPASGASLLLLEDLGTACNGSWIHGCSLAEAELAVRIIAAFHARWWRHPQLKEMGWLQLRGLISVQQAAEVFEQTWEPFRQKIGAGMPDEILKVGTWLNTHMGRLSEYFYEEQPLTLIHNDYQADNLFFLRPGPGGRLAVADWQLTTHGRSVLDVACFLGGNLESAARRRHELRLLRVYHSLLIGGGVRDYTFEQCWRDYRLAMLQAVSRLILVVGIGAVPDELEGAYCDVLIPRYCRAIRDLSALKSYWSEEVG